MVEVGTSSSGSPGRSSPRNSSSKMILHAVNSCGAQDSTLKPAKESSGVFAKVNGTIPSAFSSHYEEALRDGEERAEPELQPGLPLLPRPVDEPGPHPTATVTPSEV
ncbi:hypothetical protein HPG69_000027 [Diceros bicornis minor]|uniref:Uncharacterized protein n=1 Tax=Diceros bicornis minor TaxID=77932 RepID=A0A7J7EAD2_DICBM|nr:hypothetical protein HPG69_000027 [Diceros bicornis minor]